MVTSRSLSSIVYEYSSVKYHKTEMNRLKPNFQTLWSHALFKKIHKSKIYILFITLTASTMPTNASFCIMVCVDVTIVTTGSKPLFLITDKIDSVKKLLLFV